LFYIAQDEEPRPTSRTEIVLKQDQRGICIFPVNEIE